MLDAILNWSVRHRWLVVLLTLIAAAVGVRSLLRLPIDAVPDITNNQVQINAVNASLSPTEMEKQVTFAMETTLAGVPGLESTRSLSRNGFAQVTAIFRDDVDIYFARQQVNERLGEAGGGLPPGTDVTLGPIATGLGEIYMYTVEYEHPHGRGAAVADGAAGWQADGGFRTPEGRVLRGDVELAAYLREVQDWIIRPRLRGVKDVAGVDAIGGYVKQYHVQPDPMKLVSYGLTFRDVIEALESNNVSTGAGYVERNGESYLVRATGRIESADEIAGLIVATRNGVTVPMRDVAEVRIGRELRTGTASENGEEVVVGTAVMLIGANSRTVADAVDREMAEVQETLPPGVRAKTVLNRTKLVDATIATVRRNLLEGAGLVVVVLLVMLGNVRAALIVACAIPLSMLATATGMVQGGVSGNLMSLGAIDFGLIVDGAVIIVENCLRRLAERQHTLGRTLSLGERLEVTASAAKEMARPSAFGQAIIVTVYLPVLTFGGVEGKMFTPMAITVVMALVAAFVLSLTFVPAAVAIAMSGRVRETEIFFVRWAQAAYEPALRATLRLRWIVIAVALAAFSAALLVFTTLGQEFIPTLDEKDLAMHAMRIPSTSLTQSQAMQSELEREIATLPEVAFVFSKTGTAELAADPMSPNVSDTFVIFKPAGEWRSEAEMDKRIEALEKASAGLDGHSHGPEEHEDGGHDEHGHGPKAEGHKGKLLRLIELTVRALPGQNYEFTQPIQMRFNELIAGVRGDVAVKVYGEDFESMRRTADEVARVLGTVPGAADVKVEQTAGLGVLTVAVDRDAAGRYGLRAADVQDVVSIAVGGRDAGLVFEGDRRFDLVVRLPDDVRERVDALAELPVPLPGGAGFVPLSGVAKIDVSEGTNQVSRENGQRRVVVQANVRGRDLGSFVDEMRTKLTDVQLPPGSRLVYGGQYENLTAAKQRLAVVVPLCFLVIAALLYGSFGSVRDAVIVFSAVPLGLTGGVLSLWLRGMPFSISAAVGFIALSGVAVLNGLVMVSAIRRLQQDGESGDAAIVQGSLSRLRPVLMTALVASLGFVPMMLARGTGAEVQRPLATVVVGGLITSTLLTLVVLPALVRVFGGRVPAPSPGIPREG